VIVIGCGGSGKGPEQNQADPVVIALPGNYNRHWPVGSARDEVNAPQASPVEHTMNSNTTKRLVLLAAALGIAWSTPRSATAAPGWHDRLDAAVTRAKETGKPLFVVFRCVR